jgi:hypothetical protein
MGWLSSPKPDPAIGAAAQRTAAIAEEAQAVSRQELARARERDARFDPVYERLLAQQEAQGQQSAAFSAEELDRYRTVTRPLQDRVVADANNWDSQAEIERATGTAAATVQGQYDAARDSNVRTMGAMGVSPDSGRGVQGGVDDANSLALMKAGTVNTMTDARKQQGMALRGQAAGMMSGTAGTGMQASQLAVGANNAATAVPGAQTSAYNASLQPALSFSSSAMTGNTAAGNMMNQQYQNQVAANSAKLGAIGSAVGIGAGLYSGRMPTSDVNAKQDIEPVDGDEAMDALRKVPVSEWDYKDGQGDGGRHVGPMAQDVNAAMGEKAAPGGKKLDLITMNGMSMAAIKALDARLAKLERAGGKKPMAAPNYDVEDARLVGLEPLRI